MTWDSPLQALLLVVGGLLGSAHCLGMCGGFVVTLGANATNWRKNLARQFVYAAGRISVYTFAGAVAGFAGWRLGIETRMLVNAQAILSLVAGALLILEGCWSLNWLPRLPTPHKSCPMISFGSLLRAPSFGAVFAAGVWNGFLPCGLVYAYLALAASANGVAPGAAVMLLFGLGTVPALAVAGLSGSLLTVNRRRRLYHAAAFALIAMGVWTVIRGVVCLTPTNAVERSTCPFCVE